MRFKVRAVSVSVTNKYVIMTHEDCEKLGVDLGGRVYVTGPKGSAVLFVANSEDSIKPGEIIMATENSDKLGISDGDTADAVFVSVPYSVSYIRKKMDGKRLMRGEMVEIVKDMQNENLTYEEVAMWVTAVRIHGMDAEEIGYMATALADLSHRIQYERTPVFDYQSANGVAGNKISPIVVSIIAATGFLMPSASPRAITSVCGVSDMVGAVCDTMMDTTEIKRVAENTNGCFASTEPMGIIADKFLSFLEIKLGVATRPFIIASILGKKLAAGVTCVLIEVPTGPGTIAPTMEEAKSYMYDFVEAGKKTGMHVEAVITYGDALVGNTIGPILEIREIIEVLECRENTSSLADKACEMAGAILEMAGIFNGKGMARNILESGKALEKFREIIRSQKGDGNIASEDLKPGRYSCKIRSDFTGVIDKIDNLRMRAIAKTAGSPSDKGAGILLVKNVSDIVSEGDVVFEIYADDEDKLHAAEKMAEIASPLIPSRMVIERMSGKEVHS